MGRLIALKGKGGVSAEVFAPALAELRDLLVIKVDPEAVPAERDAQADPVVERVQVVSVNEAFESVGVALDYAAQDSVDGVVTFSEQMLAYAALIAEKLGLAYHSVASVARMQNKYLQRTTLQEHGIPVPRFHKIEHEQDLAVALDHVPLPAVFKPIYSGGSILTFQVDTPSQLRTVYEHAGCLYPKAALAKENPPIFLLEEMLMGTDWYGDARFGDYVSVESLVYQGEIFHLAVTDHLPLAYPFRETGFILPSSLAAEHQQQVFETATQALQAMDATNGAAHTEIKLTADGPRVIEINGRVGGLHPYLFAGTSNLNVMREAGNIALGIRPQAEVVFHRYMLFQTMQSPAQDVRLAAVRGIESVEKLPAIRHVTLLSEEGSQPDWRAGEGTVLGLSAITDTIEELLHLQQTVSEMIQFEYEPVEGEELL
jgi:biotin carboxylase